MRAVHGWWFYVAVGANGAVGLWGLGLAAARRTPTRIFRWAVAGAVTTMLVQVGLGLVAYGQGLRPGNDFHVFYGFVILFTLAFAYMFRVQLARRPALAWGLLLLFVMGLGLRAWANVS